MKNTFALKTIGVSMFLSAAISFVALNAFADKGGSGTGGGAYLESAFKTAAVKLGQDLVLYPASAISKLGFSPDQFQSIAYGASPQCATGADLDFLKKQKKLAYVKQAPEILLNCYKENPDELELKSDWQDLLNSLISHSELSTQSKVLLAHEVLRTAGVDSENMYMPSGTIAAADFETKRYYAEKMRLVLAGQNKSCYIGVRLSDLCGNSMTGFAAGSFISIDIKTGVLDPGESYCLPDYVGTVESFRTALIDPQAATSYVPDLIKRLKNKGCFN